MRPTMRPFLSVWRCILPSEIKEGGGGGGGDFTPSHKKYEIKIQRWR